MGLAAFRIQWWKKQASWKRGRNAGLQVVGESTELSFPEAAGKPSQFPEQSAPLFRIGSSVSHALFLSYAGKA